MSEPGCCASFCGGIWAKIKEGKVKTSARMVAFVALVGMLACAIAVGLSSDCSVSPGIIGIVTSIFLIICELPFLFGCIPQCVTCAAKMAFVMQNFIFKGFLFIGLGVGWGAMYRLASDAKCAAWILTWSIVLCFSGVLYIVAYAKGERFDEEDNSAKSMGVDTDKIKKDASDAAAKKAVQTARENPEAARSMAQKAASGII